MFIIRQGIKILIVCIIILLWTIFFLSQKYWTEAKEIVMHYNTTIKNSIIQKTTNIENIINTKKQKLIDTTFPALNESPDIADTTWSKKIFNDFIGYYPWTGIENLFTYCDCFFVADIDVQIAFTTSQEEINKIIDLNKLEKKKEEEDFTGFMQDHEWRDSSKLHTYASRSNIVETNWDINEGSMLRYDKSNGKAYFFYFTM